MSKNGVYAIYSRKSKFTGKGESIGNQVAMCREYIDENFGKEAAEAAMVYEDEGYSGKNLERPQFKRMLQDLKNKKLCGIVVYRLDRISRNLADFSDLIDKLKVADIDFISVSEKFDTSNPMGRAMMFICSVFAQLERETIAERIRDNMYELAKTGRWLGGNTPTGYESEGVVNVTVDGKTKKAYKLKMIPDEIGMVKMIFEKFLEFKSLTKTEAWLMVNGYLSKKGNKFTRFTLKIILTNPVYMVADEEAYEYLKDRVDLFSEKEKFDGVHGIMAYNRTLQNTGKSQKIKPMEEWIVAVGKHKGLIPGAKWIEVQNVLDNNKSKSYKKPRSNVALLSGILYCGNCGDYMRPKLTQRTNAAGDLIYNYLCSQKEHSKSQLCKMKNPNGNLLDAMVIDEIKKITSDGGEVSKLLDKRRKEILVDTESLCAEQKRLQNAIEENEASIKSLVKTLAKAAGTPAEAYIMEEISQLHRTVESQKTKLQEVESLMCNKDMDRIEFESLVQKLLSFGAMVDECSVEEKRALIRALVKKVVWDGENVQMYLFDQDGEVRRPNEPLCERSE